MSEVGKRLRSRRVALRMTQDELAARLFVTRQTISNYERGLSEPDLDTLQRLASLLETDVAYLLGSEKTEGQLSLGIQRDQLPGFFLGLGLSILDFALLAVLGRRALEYKAYTYDAIPMMRVVMTLVPLGFLFIGWTLVQLVSCVAKLPELPQPARIGIHLAVFVGILSYVVAAAPFLMRVKLESPSFFELSFLWAAQLCQNRGRWIALLFGTLLRFTRKNNNLTRGQDMV